jgi:formyltetrahydrofolate synthetase|tara:strand:- start:880 stop:1188 length:309 start_codon:yes stop_codon:yes gene_type:complete
MDDMNAHEKTRLDRIEEKIDKMADAIIALARAEEKISAQEESTRIILKRMVDQDDRLRLIERDLSHVEDTTRTIKSVVWTITTAIIGSIAAAFVWMFDIPTN